MTVAELIERLKALPPDMPVLEDSECEPGLHPLTDLYMSMVGPKQFMGRRIIRRVYAKGPDTYEALVF